MKNTGIPNPGVEVVASKLLPNYIEFMPCYLGAFTQEQWVRFPPQTSFPLSPHLFKAQTYLQFQTSFHVPRIRRWKASTLFCTRKIWM